MASGGDDAGLTVSREEVFHKRHPFDLWVRRTGLDEAVVTAICAEILAAPPKIQEAFFEIDGDHIVALLDRKLILRADRTET